MMPVIIKNIKEKETFWLLKSLARATKSVWKIDVWISNAESNAEYELAIAKSKRIEDDIDIFSELSLDLGWGCEKVNDKKSGVTVIRKIGDFNPWYKGKLTLNELLSALEDLYGHYLGYIDPEIDEIEFVYYYERVREIYLAKKPKIDSTPEIFWDQLHKNILKISKSRFESGHYADAVEAALKHVNVEVKSIVKSVCGEEFDGAVLMNKAFSPNDPIIVLDDLTTDSGRNIQTGYMQIFAGSMTGIRNPKAHDNINIDKKRTIHLLFLSSLLLSKLEEKINVVKSRKTKRR